jgi:hypothetical protein
MQLNTCNSLSFAIVLNFYVIKNFAIIYIFKNYVVMYATKLMMCKNNDMDFFSWFFFSHLNYLAPW